MSDRLTIYGWLYYRGYRLLMRTAHRFGWHHAPPNYALREPQGVLCRCQWCGLAGFMWDATASANAEMQIIAESKARVP